MKTRIAKKIVKQNLICCQRYFGGPEHVPTAGSIRYPYSVYRKALLLVLRKMDRIAKRREAGCIRQLALLNEEKNQLRLKHLIARAA